MASALAVARIHAFERRDKAVQASGGQSAWRELVQGVRFVWVQPAVRAVTGATGTFYLFRDMVGVVIMLYFVRVLHLSPALMGPLFAVGAVSSFAGAGLAGCVVRRWGARRTLAGALLLNALGGLCIPLAGGPLWLIALTLAAAQLFDAAATIYEIDVVSLRQAHTPERLQGRVHACAHVVEGAAQLAGLLIGILGALLAVPWIVLAPARALET